MLSEKLSLKKEKLQKYSFLKQELKKMNEKLPAAAYIPFFSGYY